MSLMNSQKNIFTLFGSLSIQIFERMVQVASTKGHVLKYASHEVKAFPKAIIFLCLDDQRGVSVIDRRPSKRASFIVATLVNLGRKRK